MSLSDGWETRTLKDVCDITSSTRIYRREYVKRGVPFYRGKEIIQKANNEEISNPLCISQKRYQEIRRKHGVPKPGDILLTSVGTLGVPYVVESGERFYFKDGNLTWFRDYSEIDELFLYYWLISPQMKDQINASHIGVAQPALTIAGLKSFKIDLPPLPTQHKIAAILSAYDELIENNTRRIAILEEMAQLLYREWFVHFRFPGYEDMEMVDSELGAIPKGWGVVAFTDVADVLTGSTPRTKVEKYWNGSIPFFSPRDIETPVYVLETERSITQLGLDNCSSDLYPKNTVFITARGTVGRVVMPAVPMAMNQTCYALRGRDGISQYYIFLDIQNQVARLQQRAHGAVFDTIIIDTFRQLDVVKPLSELIVLFHRRVTPLFEQILNLLRRNVVLRQARDLLLPRLISGELDVEDLPIDVTSLEP
jgi:type I restriction enzyme S subunit